MKKIILTILIVLFLSINLLAIDFNSYLGKNVEITLINGRKIIGVLTFIHSLEICQEQDIIGNCVQSKNYYILEVIGERSYLIRDDFIAEIK